MPVAEVIEDGAFSPALIAEAFRTTKTGVVGTFGLGQDAFSRASRISARMMQTRLREMVEILNRVEAVVGSPLGAYAWFRSEPLQGFGDTTPDQLVRDGRADFFHRYLDRVMAGGYA